MFLTYFIRRAYERTTYRVLVLILLIDIENVYHTSVQIVITSLFKYIFYVQESEL